MKGQGSTPGGAGSGGGIRQEGLPHHSGGAGGSGGSADDGAGGGGGVGKRVDQQLEPAVIPTIPYTTPPPVNRLARVSFNSQNISIPL